MTTGREWYPAIFAELERIGATEAGFGVREVLDGEDDEDDGTIWIEFFNDAIADLCVCAIDDAPDFLDSLSAGEGLDSLEFLEAFNEFFSE